MESHVGPVSAAPTAHLTIRRIKVRGGDDDSGRVMQTPQIATGAAAPARTAAGAVLTAPAMALPVAVGQQLAARVLALSDGLVDLSLAGGRLTARTDAALRPGETLRLVVERAGPDATVLKLLPAPATGTGAERGAATAQGAASSAAGALRAAGLPVPAAAALLAALAQTGGAAPTPAQAAALGARAAAAGVGTPAQAAAFARLEHAGVMPTRAAVGGLAALAEGPPLGRALAAVVDAVRATAPASSAPVPSAPAPTAPAPTSGQAAQPGTSGTATTSPPAPAAAPASPGGAAALSPSPLPAAPAAPAGPATPAQSAQAAPAAPAGPAALGAALADLTDALSRAVVDGRGGELRAAIAALGAGGTARAADDAPVRALLVALATHPATDPGVARAAAAVADAVGAQALATPAGTQAQAQAPAHQGAYLQLPLPGGGTAEVRVDPDAGGDRDGHGAGRRTIAFLLNLSALGPVMITASAGPDGVEAAVRTSDEGARAHLTGEAHELARALAVDGTPARVRVEPSARPVPERLVAPPPATGLDRRA